MVGLTAVVLLWRNLVMNDGYSDIVRKDGRGG